MKGFGVVAHGTATACEFADDLNGRAAEEARATGADAKGDAMKTYRVYTLFRNLTFALFPAVVC